MFKKANEKAKEWKQEGLGNNFVAPYQPHGSCPTCGRCRCCSGSRMPYWGQVGVMKYATSDSIPLGPTQEVPAQSQYDYFNR